MYSRVPGHRNWQIETAVWNLAGFLRFQSGVFDKPAGNAAVFDKPADNDVGSFLMLYTNISNVKSTKET